MAKHLPRLGLRDPDEHLGALLGAQYFPYLTINFVDCKEWTTSASVSCETSKQTEEVLYFSDTSTSCETWTYGDTLSLVQPERVSDSPYFGSIYVETVGIITFIILFISNFSVMFIVFIHNFLSRS